MNLLYSNDVKHIRILKCLLSVIVILTRMYRENGIPFTVKQSGFMQMLHAVLRKVGYTGHNKNNTSFTCKDCKTIFSYFIALINAKTDDSVAFNFGVDLAEEEIISKRIESNTLRCVVIIGDNPASNTLMFVKQDTPPIVSVNDVYRKYMSAKRAVAK